MGGSMERTRNHNRIGRWLFLGVHALILLAGLAVFLFVSAEADKAAGENVFFVYPQTPSAPAFSPDDLAVIEETLATRATDASGQAAVHAYALSYEANAMRLLANTTAQVYCRVTATSHASAGMHRLAFAEGAFFGEAAARTRVVVLSKALAWRLLGAANVVGREITIDDEWYTVVGVVTQGDGDYSSDALYAYIPTNNKTETTVANMYIQSQNYSRLNDAVNITSALRAIPRNPANYGVCDLNGYIQTMNSRPLLLLAFASIWVLFLLAFRLFREAKRLSSSARNAAIRNLCVIVLAAVPCVIALRMGFNALPVVPGGGLAEILSAVFNHDALPGAAYVTGAVLRLRALNTLSAAAFIAGLAAVGELFLAVALAGYGRRE